MHMRIKVVFIVCCFRPAYRYEILHSSSCSVEPGEIGVIVIDRVDACHHTSFITLPGAGDPPTKQYCILLIPQYHNVKKSTNVRARGEKIVCVCTLSCPPISDRKSFTTKWWIVSFPRKAEELSNRQARNSLYSYIILRRNIIIYYIIFRVETEHSSTLYYSMESS